MKLTGFKTTKKGRELIAKLLAGESLTISKVVAGTGVCVTSEQLDLLEDLISPVMVGTSSKPTYFKDTCEMTLQFRSDLYQGGEVFIQEYGVFALDPDVGEILLYYAALGDDPQKLIGVAGKYAMVLNFAVAIAIGEDLQGVHLGYPAAAFLLAEELELHNSCEEAHENLMFPRICLSVSEEVPTVKGVTFWISDCEEYCFPSVLEEEEKNVK